MSIRLLIVDDHETVREGWRYAFEGGEIATVEATNGETALAVVFSQQINHGGMTLARLISYPQLRYLAVRAR